MKKIAFITGVSSGIGHATALQFLKDGFTVIGTVRSTSLGINDLSANESFYPVIFDVADPGQIPMLNDAIKQIAGDHGIDVLVNNAGIATGGPMELLTEEQINEQMQVNFFGVRRVTNTLLPYLKQNRGYIINISSISGLFTSPYLGAYCASKYALEAMTDAYRRELAQWGVKVVLIEPGPIQTPIWKKSEGLAEQYKDTIYAHHMKKADKMVSNSEKTALPVESVVKIVSKVLRTPKPKDRYLVIKNGWIFKALVHLIPTSIIDNKVVKALGGGEKFRPI